MDYAIAKTEVADYLKLLKTPHKAHPIDENRCDYGFYGNHKDRKPYSTILEGINWYLQQPTVQLLPEEMIIPMVAHNFGITVDEALKRVQAEEHIEQAKTGEVNLD